MFPFNAKLFFPGLAAATIVHPAEEHLRYAPAAGSTLERTWAFDTSTSVDEFTLFLGGREQSIGDGMTREGHTALVVRDTIHGVAAGRPTRLDRTLVSHDRDTETSGAEGEGVQVRDRDDEASALVDQTVTFAWDGDEERFVASYAEGSTGEASWLEDLSEDMDLRALLPDGPVEPGATWEVEPAVLDELLQPGGRLGVFPAGGGGDAPEGGVSIRLPDPSSIGRYCDLPGEFTVTFEGVEDEGGARVAKLVLVAKVEGALDVADSLDERAEAEGIPRNDYDEAELERALEGRGVLRWDLGLGRMRSLTFEADVKTTFSAAWSVDAGGMDLPIEVTQTAHGTLAIAAAVEAAD